MATSSKPVREIKMQATEVFLRNQQATKRIVLNQGGTRSSKTYSIAQLFALRAKAATEPEIFTICRKTLPALKATAMKDFFTVLKVNGWYDERFHNKSDHIYQLGKSEIEFISVDEPQKIRGRKRKTLWINEGNELEFEDFQQLILRTTGQVFIDFNPSDEYHWLYDRVLVRPDCELIKSTYLDNPFLEETTIQEIEMLKDTDANYWKIYGLGERGTSENKIYTHWQYCDEIPEGCEIIYGLDFGFNHATALVKIGLKDDDVYMQEKIYETHLTNGALIDRMKEMKAEIGDNYIYADAAEPNRIKEIEEAGFNIYPADKDVTLGIDTLKRHKFFITKDSVNGLKEVKAYSWKVGKDGRRTDDPVKVNDHFLDAGRYGAYTYSTMAQPGIEYV